MDSFRKYIISRSIIHTDEETKTYHIALCHDATYIATTTIIIVLKYKQVQEHHQAYYEKLAAMKTQHWPLGTYYLLEKELNSIAPMSASDVIRTVRSSILQNIT